MTPTTMLILTVVALGGGVLARTMGCALKIISKLLFFAACVLSVMTVLAVLAAGSVI